MMTLKQKQEILLMYLREGKSQREIARMTGIARKTIRKYIQSYEQKLNELEEMNVSVDRSELIQELVETPRYPSGVRRKRVLTEEMKEKIKGYLQENKEKRAKGLYKQQKKVMDIYEALVEGGMKVSYSTVLRTIRQLEKKVKEAYIKGFYQPGDICEFDWGEVNISIAGHLRNLQMAVFTSAYGNYRMAYLFTKQKTECFQEAHALFFQEAGGVYRTLVYDNMRVAVRRFVGKSEKEPTEGLLKLSLYYGFGFRFCNIRKGNEKGHVERGVEVVRRKAFAFRDSFETLEEANIYLYSVCERLNEKSQPERESQTAHACLKTEQAYFLPLRPPFDAARCVDARVDKYATLVIDQSHYSVPDHLVGEMVHVKIYTNRIQCYYDGEKIAEHQRLAGNHEWSLHLDHYVRTLMKKPGALAGSTALQQADQRIQSIYHTYYINHEREFIELIQYIKSGVSLSEVEQSIRTLFRIHPSHVTTDKIKILCARNQVEKQVLPSGSEETRAIHKQAEMHLKLYDELFHTETVGQLEEVR
ncbi:IS21 family transposase [Sporolactobacillus shoreae]|uniref:IS21 family transposase n=1 Tax=Sporolactobacillus shoreae TaxID=1465501 RepID=A0A4Z0GGC9_9BACL|nr:IS21 family transposase [Sporolactobacillus shoreae]TGA95455.1 IS21 family transposase [Sporolactobacillus shoreae]